MPGPRTLEGAAAGYRLGMSPDAPTRRVRKRYDRMAPRYDQLMDLIDRLLFAGGRRWVCQQAEGEVLEVAIGTGRTLPAYPEGVHLTGIELAPAMVEIARERAAALGRECDLRVGDAQALPFPARRFDTVVCTLSLCSIPDERRAVQEMWRVLRPGGRLLLLEHVRSPVRAVRIGQELIEPLFLWLQRDHLLREPLDTVECVGFEVEQLHRSKLGIVERLSARKPRG